MDTKYLNIPNGTEGAKNEFTKIKPNQWPYIFNNIGLPFFMIIVAVFSTIFFGSEGNYIIGYIFAFIGVYGFFHLMIVHSKIYYIIDEEGVHIKSISYIFQSEIEKIKYREIKEVIVEQGMLETDNDIGTVKIHKGVYNDGDKEYSKLIGIEKYKEIADLLKQKAGLEK